MAVNSIVLCKIIRECCRSLSYDDGERHFSFKLKPYLADIWENIKTDVQIEMPGFYLSDFNRFLERLSDQENLCIKIEVEDLSDEILLNGEVLECTLIEGNTPLRLIKMKNGQYLNVCSGKGYSFGRTGKFIKNGCLRTSEGCELGVINSITLLSPSCEHMALSKIFIGNYYRNRIADSIWPIFNMAVMDGIPKNGTDLSIFLHKSKDMGINSFTLLNILNAAVNVWNN